MATLGARRRGPPARRRRGRPDRPAFSSGWPCRHRPPSSDRPARNRLALPH